MRESMKGKKNPRWVGDKVKYESIHGYVKRYIKKPNKCEICDKKTPSLDLAYKDMDSGRNNVNYSRNLNKWFYICRSCHMKADGRMNNLKQYRINKFTPEDVEILDGIKVMTEVEQSMKQKQTNKLYNTEYTSKSNQSPQSGLESVKKIESASEDNVSEIEPYSQSDTFCLKDKIYGGLHEHIDLKDVKEFIKIILEDINNSTKEKRFFDNSYDLSLIYSFETNLRKIIKNRAGDL